MIRAYLRRGLAAGLLAGLLAGVFGYVAGEPSIEDAIAIEDAAADPGAGARVVDHGHGADDDPQISRPLQRAGLIAGSGLVGLAAGVLFGLASAWAVGRVGGDAWARSLKLGAAAVGALVVLPALKYPPNPPAVGDPDTVGLRTGLFLVLMACGVLLAFAAWSAARLLQDRLPSQPVRHVVLAIGVLGAAGGLLLALPSVGGGVDVPHELVWRFRLAAVGTQAALYLVLAAAFGLLAARDEQRAPAMVG